jgi:hypothetical protein
MSTFVMGLCWPLQIPPTPKAVLMSLADQSNDQGACWPSMPSIVLRTCYGRTAVIEAVKWLEANGYLSIEKAGGRTNRYTLALDRLRQREIEPVRQADQSGSRTSPRDAPPPVRQADEPVRQADPNRKEPSVEPKKKTPAVPAVEPALLIAAGFTETQAADFIAHKHRLKAPLTDRAWKDHLREAEKAGWTPANAAEKVMAKSWKGFEAKYVMDEKARFASIGSTTVAHNPQIEQTARLLAQQAEHAKAATPPPAAILAMRSRKTEAMQQ